MSRAAVADPLRAGESDADTRIRHGDHHGGRWNGAWAGGGQIAAGSAAVPSDKEDVVTQKRCSGPGSCTREPLVAARQGPEFSFTPPYRPACMFAACITLVVGRRC